MARTLLVGLLLIVMSGCATVATRTSGTAGSIAWQATDLTLARRQSDNRWTYSWTLLLRDDQGVPLTFTELEAWVYQPGTSPASFTRKGSWSVAARGQLRLPFSSSLGCHPSADSCGGPTVPTPLWKIILTGKTPGGEDVRTVIDVSLPPDPPPSAVAKMPLPAISSTPPPVSGPAPVRSLLRAPAATSAIPIEIVENVVLVPVTLNGSHRATFLLDTGSQHTILSPELAKRLGVVPRSSVPRRQVTIMGGTKIDVPFVGLSTLELGDALFGSLEVGVHRIAPEVPLIDGLLGADVLSHFTMTVDRAARQLRLEATK